MNSTTPDTYTNSTSPSTELVVYLEICIFTFNFLFGLSAHSYIIWLIVTGAKSRIASEFFILNLSVCDIVNTMNSLVFILSAVFPCLSKLVAFLQGQAISGRPLFQCLICVERYLAVVHPVTFLKFKPLRYRVICCTVTWIFTLGPCLFCRFILHPIRLKEYACFLLLQFLLFLSVQLFCLVAVLIALKQSGPGERGREREEENNMKRKAFQLILITTVNVTIIHVPYAFIALNTILTQYNREHWFIALVCYVLAGFVQPVLYLHRAGKLPCLCSS